MTIEKNVSLLPYNTFGIDARADELVELHSPDDLRALLHSGRLRGRHYIVGGGSNLVFAGDYHGLIVALRTQGIALLREEGDDLYVEAQAGVVWDDFVRHCIAQGWHGMENLAAIPGTVGAAPVQNVGAYGKEAKDVIHEVLAYHIATGELRRFRNEECQFAYRHSAFKGEWQGQYIVASVVFRLSKLFRPAVDYKAVAAALSQAGIEHPDATQLADTIAAVRWSKLPRPEERGSAGSFFKNPVVSHEHYQQLLRQEPDLVAFPIEGDGYKLAAGWLIEQCGWRGKSKGRAGVCPTQALVLENRGGCNGSEVLALADAIVADVQRRFGVTLEKEAIVLE